MNKVQQELQEVQAEEVKKKGVGGKGTGARGATTMASVIKNSLTQKIPIQINEKGVAVGENRATFNSYLGVAVRAHVSIAYTKWIYVPMECKDKLWDDLKVIHLVYYYFT